jgi:hypothetical protein
MSDEDAFQAGMKDWDAGGPMPSYPRLASGAEFFHWLGFMLARGRDFFRRREMALYPDTVEPRP